MPRRRRDPAEAREEILDAAERLFAQHGPDGVRVAKVAKEVGISHPGVLHHFGSAAGLVEALHQRASRRIRDAVLEPLRAGKDRREALLAAAEALADPAKGRLLAWVVAAGGDPFPPVEEQGLAAVADEVGEDARRVLLVVLAMIGESMVGPDVRARLGMDPDDDGFRGWLFELLAR